MRGMFGLGESEAALRFYRTFPRRVKSDTLLGCAAAMAICLAEAV